MRYSYFTGKRYFVKSVSLCPILSHITLVIRIYRFLKMGKGMMVYFTLTLSYPKLFVQIIIEPLLRLFPLP